MSKEKQIEIEVITYEQDRLNYFTDLMEKAQKSYDRLYKKYKDSPYLFDGTTFLSDAGKELSFYKDVVEMLKQRDWISVEERLPEKDGKYLCYMLWKNGTGWFECLDFGTNLEKASGCFDGVERSGFYYFDPDWGDVETKEVTHWMPLPEPPKKGGGE